MTGAEHYRESEKLLASCQLVRTGEHEIYPAVGPGHEDDVDSCRNALMAAQIHATLALVDAVRHSSTDHKAIGQAINDAVRTGARRARKS